MSDFVYVDLYMTYDSEKVSGGAKKQYASKIVTRTSPILSKPSDYYGMISKAVIDTYDMPLFVPLIQIGQSNPNLTPYCFQLGYNGVYSDPQYVEFTSYNSFEPTPSAPITKQDVSSTYYYVFNYSEFLTCFNNAIALALINLNSKTNTGETEPPIFYFDKSSGIVVYFPTNKYDQPVSQIPNTNSIQLYFNDEVAPLVNGLGASLVNNGQICNIMFYAYDELFSSPPITSYRMSMQNISQCCYWNVVKTIYLNTNIPIVPEFSQAPIYSNQPQNQTNVSLFDFSPDSSDITSYSNSLVYNKVDSLRLFEMASDTPMYSLSLTINFTDNYGRQFQTFLSPGIAHHIKLEFVKKDVYASINDSTK